MICKANKLKVSLVLLFIGIFLNLKAQYEDVRFEHILVSDGLVQSAVVDILIDDYGYIWFATRGGLSRFDGYEFVNYLRDPEDTTTLSNSSVWKLLADEKHNIWAGTNNGLNLFDRTTESFHQYLDSRLENNSINDIVFWSEDELILGTQLGPYLFDIKEKRYTKPNELFVLDNQSVNDIHQLSNGKWLFGTDKGLYEYSDRVRKIDEGVVNSLFEDRNKNVWVDFEGELYLYTNSFNKKRRVSQNSSVSYYGEIASDGNDHIIFTKSKVQVFDLEGVMIREFENDPEIEYSLLSNRASCIEIGKDGIWWIGINGLGGSKYDPNFPSISYLGQSTDGNLSLSENYVTRFYTDDDNTVFIGTGNGLDVYHKNQNRIDNIYPNAQVDFLYHDNGNIWFAIKDSLFQYNIANDVISDRHFIDGLYRIKFIQKDPQGYLWIACQPGLIKFNPSTLTQEVFVALDNSIQRPTQDWVTYLEDMGATYLIGTAVGLYELDKATETVTKINQNGRALTKLKNSYVKCIEKDNTGIYWIGTWGEGVFRWNSKTDSMKQYLRKDGLPDDVIYGVLQDDDGFLWMSSNRGLTRFDPKTESFFNIDVSYRLQSNEFNTSAYFKSTNNVLYFGGVEGLNFFDPKGIENKIVPDTYVSGLSLYNQQTSGRSLGEDQSILDLETITLNHTQNMLGFDFRGTNMTVPKLNQYAYYLEGLEDDWNYVGDRRFANYTSIPPGEYTFKVKSSNNNGFWDESPRELRIIIEPPFWQTWWFRIGGLLFVSGILFGAYRLRVKALRNQKLTLERIVNERTSELKNMMEILRNNSRQLTETGERLKNRSSKLADEAKKQADTTKLIETDISEVTGHTRKTTENATKTNEISEITVEQLEQIRLATQENIKVIKDISERISVIEEIFRQTNILSLNASVEAARAGRHGGGFAVIAEEVRKLANNSKDASQEIIESAKVGTEKTEAMGQLILDFLPEIEKSAELIREIADSSNIQNGFIENINLSLSEFFKTSRQNSEISAEIYQISSELDEVAKYLNDQVMNIEL